MKISWLFILLVNCCSWVLGAAERWHHFRSYPGISFMSVDSEAACYCQISFMVEEGLTLTQGGFNVPIPVPIQHWRPEVFRSLESQAFIASSPPSDHCCKDLPLHISEHTWLYTQRKITGVEWDAHSARSQALKQVSSLTRAAGLQSPQEGRAPDCVLTYSLTKQDCLVSLWFTAASSCTGQIQSQWIQAVS